jgi:hypothetical protein
MKQNMREGPVDSVDALRRKVFAEQNAQKMKRDLTINDPLIARAYAEIEEEDRYLICFLPLSSLEGLHDLFLSFSSPCSV